jgi:hypothetical protein
MPPAPQILTAPQFRIDGVNHSGGDVLAHSTYAPTCAGRADARFDRRRCADEVADFEQIRSVLLGRIDGNAGGGQLR